MTKKETKYIEKCKNTIRNLIYEKIDEIPKTDNIYPAIQKVVGYVAFAAQAAFLEVLTQTSLVISQANNQKDKNE